MIIHPLRTALLHPTRTGGSTIEAFYAKSCGVSLADNSGAIEHWGNLDGLPMVQCLPANLHPGVAEARRNGYLFAMSVRDPYKRAASMLGFLGQPDMHTLLRYCATNALESFPLPQWRYIVPGMFQFRICDGETTSHLPRGFEEIATSRLNAAPPRELSALDREIVREIYDKDFDVFGYVR